MAQNAENQPPIVVADVVTDSVVDLRGDVQIGVTGTTRFRERFLMNYINLKSEEQMRAIFKKIDQGNELGMRCACTFLGFLIAIVVILHNMHEQLDIIVAAVEKKD